MSDHSMRQLLTALMLVSIVVDLIGAVIGSVIAAGLSECSSTSYLQGSCAVRAAIGAMLHHGLPVSVVPSAFVDAPLGLDLGSTSLAVFFLIRLSRLSIFSVTSPIAF